MSAWPLPTGQNLISADSSQVSSRRWIFPADICIPTPQVSEEEGMAQPSEVQLAFTLRLFDLNQDLTLTTDEMLTSLALDAVVGALILILVHFWE